LKFTIPTEYELHYTSSREGDHPDDDIPFGDIAREVRLDGDKRNKVFCKSFVLYTNPPGAPKDEVALVTGLNATGVMMEWERPISMSFALIISFYQTIDSA
jgi:hypothetical protein